MIQCTRLFAGYLLLSIYNLSPMWFCIYLEIYLMHVMSQVMCQPAIWHSRSTKVRAVKWILFYDLLISQSLLSQCRKMYRAFT